MSEFSDYLSSHPELRRRLINYMKDKHHTQASCARLLGMNIYTFRNFVLELRPPRMATMSKVEQFLEKEGY